MNNFDQEKKDMWDDQNFLKRVEIQIKYIDDKNVLETEIDSQKQRIELLERNNVDQEKKDMWDDQNFLNGVLQMIQT